MGIHLKIKFVCLRLYVQINKFSVIFGWLPGFTITKGGITPEEDHEDLTASWKIEGRSENVVKMKPFQVYKNILRPYHVLKLRSHCVLARFLLRPSRFQ